MERKNNSPSDHLPNREYESIVHDIGDSLLIDFRSGKDLIKIKDELATLRYESMGGSLEDHQEWLEKCVKHGDYLTLLHVHKGEIVSALLGKVIPLDELPLNIYEYIAYHSQDALQRPVLWCASIVTHPRYQGRNLAGDCLSYFVDYIETFYRVTGAFLACRIREQNFASEFAFRRAGFQQTNLLDEEDAHGKNYINFRFWVKSIPPLYSDEATAYFTDERRRQLHNSNLRAYRPPDDESS